MEVNDHHKKRMEFLRPLSMTCKAVRLRLLPWIWERLEFIPGLHPGEKKLTAIVNVLRADVCLAISVKYFCALFCPWVGVDLHPLQVHDTGSLAEGFRHSIVRQMLTIPPKSPHIRDRAGGCLRYEPTQGRAQARQTPPD